MTTFFLAFKKFLETFVVFTIQIFLAFIFNRLSYFIIHLKHLCMADTNTPTHTNQRTHITSHQPSEPTHANHPGRSHRTIRSTRTDLRWPSRNRADAGSLSSFSKQS